MGEEPVTTSHEGRWVITGGTVFDGSGGEGRTADVVIEDGVVRELVAPSTEVGDARQIDATGCWVTPGFIDLHTHYDAELEIAPGLTESVRHGVTTVMVGSCGLSMACGDPVDLADMFCRVEGIPRTTVKPLFERIKDWDGPAGYLEHLGSVPLGPNVACLLGHSTIRAHTMGLGRSLDARTAPTEDEMKRMEALVSEALDAGYLGMSINTLPWDKMDGDDYRSRPTPSVFASWSEYRRLAGLLRQRERVFQGVPNLRTKLNIFLFLLASTGLGRKPLKTTIIALIDAKAARGAFRMAELATRFVNRFLRANVRFQALPNVFDLWTDGMEVPVLEEIGAGTEALHLQDAQSRARLLRDPDYRQRFKRQWASWVFGKAYHRDLQQTEIIDAPDRGLIGKSFGDVGRDRGISSVDAYLDLVAEHGNALRWYTVVGNDRPRWLQWIMTRPDILIGFSDAGAHLRNMAYYNFGLRMLKQVRDAERAGRPFMTVGAAVRRLTAEIAEWMGIDAGLLAPSRRADVTIVDPRGLDDDVERIIEAPMPGFSDLRRLVRRNDAAVRAVFVSGRLAYRREPDMEGPTFEAGFGTTAGFGRVLGAIG